MHTCPIAETGRGTSIDLGSALVDGHRVLGRSIAGVTAALGTPTWHETSGRHYRIGYGDRINFRVMVLFQKESGTYRAVTIAFEQPPLYERRIALNVLALPPAAAVSRTIATYSNVQLERPRRCRAAICNIVLQVVGTNRHLTFGHTARGNYLSLWTS